MNGRFHEGDLLASSAVQASVDDWTITLDQGANDQVLRIRAPFYRPAGVAFDVRRTNERIRRVIGARPRVRVSLRKRTDSFRSVPEGVDVLQLLASAKIKDVAQLRKLFELVAEVLRETCYEGGVFEDDVRTHTRRLRAPRARIEGRNIVLWDNRASRRNAAKALERLGDRAAITVLASVLGDEDNVVRALAVDALARIGDSSAIRPLVPWLGDGREADGRPFGDRVADALRQLGEADLVDAVLGALGGEIEALKPHVGGDYRDEIVEALVGALGGPLRYPSAVPTSRSVAAAADALGEMNAAKALPDLRKVLRAVGPAGVVGTAVSRAISKLETRASLPRAASGADVVRDRLPRPASGTGGGRRNLPRRPRT